MQAVGGGGGGAPPLPQARMKRKVLRHREKIIFLLHKWTIPAVPPFPENDRKTEGRVHVLRVAPSEQPQPQEARKHAFLLYTWISWDFPRSFWEVTMPTISLSRHPLPPLILQAIKQNPSPTPPTPSIRRLFQGVFSTLVSFFGNNLNYRVAGEKIGGRKKTSLI